MTECGQVVAVTHDQLNAIEDYSTAGLGGNDAVLVAAVDGGDTVIGFVRRDNQWSAHHIAENGGVEALYRSQTGDAFAWAFEGRGDPPFAFSALYLPAAGSAGQFCTAFDVPGDLNQPDWKGEAFAFEQFNLSADGKGAIIGSSEVERDGSVQNWIFKYETSDNGRQWSEPVRLEGPETLQGIYSRIDEQDEALLKDLRTSL